MFQVLKATQENPTKNDFVMTCNKYLKTLEISVSFDEISKLSDSGFKRLLKEKVKNAAFTYLIKEKGKQSKILEIKYEKLEIQEYLLRGDRDINVSKCIFEARGNTLDIKSHKKWKYENKLCSGCNENDETGEEIFQCTFFGENLEKIGYSWFYRGSVNDQIVAAKSMIKKLRESVT